MIDPVAIEDHCAGRVASLPALAVALVLLASYSACSQQAHTRAPKVSERVVKKWTSEIPGESANELDIQQDGTRIRIEKWRVYSCTVRHHEKVAREVTKDGHSVTKHITKTTDSDKTTPCKREPVADARFYGEGVRSPVLTGGNSIDLGVTNAEGHLELDLVDLIDVDMLGQARWLTVKEEQKVGMVQLSELHRHYRQVAWEHAQASSCATPTSARSCDAVKELIQRYLGSLEAAKARALLLAAAPKLKVFAEREAWQEAAATITACTKTKAESAAEVLEASGKLAQYLESFSDGLHVNEVKRALATGQARAKRLAAIEKRARAQERARDERAQARERAREKLLASRRAQILKGPNCGGSLCRGKTPVCCVSPGLPPSCTTADECQGDVMPDSTKSWSCLSRRDCNGAVCCTNTIGSSCQPRCDPGLGNMLCEKDWECKQFVPFMKLKCDPAEASWGAPDSVKMCRE